MKQGEPEGKRAFIYCRTSDDSEEEDGTKVSIEAQEETGRELAKRHGYVVVDVFKDRNRSGRLYPKGFEIPDPEVDAYCNECKYSTVNRSREQFGKMLRRLREVEVIIVRRADRLMRPLPLSKLDVHILTILKANNVIVHSHDDNIIDPHNPDHIFIFKVTSTIHSRYVADRREETKTAIRKIRDSGKLYFPPHFYGFRTGGHQQVKRVPEEIAIVQRIFKEFLAGNTFKGIARGLNSANPPIPTLTHKGKSKDGTGFWLDSTVRVILKRTHYAGFQYKSNGTEEVQVPVFHPPIIPYDLFKKVQSKMEERKHANVGNTKDVHALTGLVRCGVCGYQLYTTATYMRCNDTKYKVESLRCITYTKTKKEPDCKGVQIRERFPKGLKRRDGKPYANGLEDCLFPLIYKGYINHLIAKNQRVGLDTEIEECQAILERNQNYTKNLGQKLRDAILDDKTFDDLIRDAKDARVKVEQKLAVLQKEAHAMDRMVVPKDLYADYASHKMDNDLKRRLFHSVIEHVDVWHTHIIVSLKGGGEFRLERLRAGKTYALPAWRILESNPDSYRKGGTRDGVPRGKYKHTPITVDTKIDVVYEYDNFNPLKTVYGDNNLVVMTEGVKKVVPVTGS